MLPRRDGTERRSPADRGGRNHACALTAAVLLALAAPLTLAPGPARAQYAEGRLNTTQSGVPAEANAENSVVAREKGLANGRRAAWNRMVSEAGSSPVTLSDSAIEAMVSSMVIEEERTTQTRYNGRITVSFDPAAVRAQLARGGAAGAASGSAAAGGEVPPIAGGPATRAPASAWVDAVAIYRSMPEWLELNRRLQTAAPVAAVEIQGLAIDAARLRLGLRSAPQVAAGELAAAGISLVPEIGGAPGAWRVGLAGG